VTRPSIIGLAAVILLSTGTMALAQGVSSAARSRPRTWEFGGGVVYVGGYDLGEATAELTSNTGTTGGSFPQFETDSQVKSAVGVQGRIGFLVTPSFAIEGGLRFSKPVLEIRITDDAEDAADLNSEETISQYLIDASAVWHFTNAAFGSGKAVPFVFGGAGYLRELHEGDALIEEGVEYHAGGGIKWWFGEGRGRFGFRGEVGISIRDGGFDFEETRRVVPIAAGSLVYTF
jgi:hypothetical protein